MNLALSALFKYSVYLFWVVALVNLYGLMFYSPLEQITKPFIVPILCLYYFSGNNRDSAYMMALFFSWIGNVLIMSPGFAMILAGVICFWGMLLLYSYHILKNLPGSLVDQFKKKYAKTIVTICLVYLIIIVGVLYEDLGKLIPAILFYGVTLTGAGFLSIMLWLKQKEKTTFALMSGMILLIISGTLLTVKLFAGNNLLIETLIRLSYIVAQFLVCLYFLKNTSINKT